MHRRPLLEAIAEYGLRYPEEHVCVGRFAEFVHRYTNCFSRALLPGHVTGSAWVVDADGHRTLLTHHRKLDIWVQLGGHSDDDPDPRAVALREAREESGLDDLILADGRIFDLDIHSIPARGSEPAHEHFDVRYVVRVVVNTQFRVSAESKALAWVAVGELDSLTREASMLRMRDKWLRMRDKWLRRDEGTAA